MTELNKELSTAFVLTLDLENLSDDDVAYLHKLRALAQRQIIEKGLTHAFTKTKL